MSELLGAWDGNRYWPRYLLCDVMGGGVQVVIPVKAPARGKQHIFSYPSCARGHTLTLKDKMQFKKEDWSFEKLGQHLHFTKMTKSYYFYRMKICKNTVLFFLAFSVLSKSLHSYTTMLCAHLQLLLSPFALVRAIKSDRLCSLIIIAFTANANMFIRFSQGHAQNYTLYCQADKCSSLFQIAGNLESR